MAIERPTRRMTLRQQLTHAEKCSRDILEHINGTVLPYVSDLRDLSRPVRRRSHYPTLVALQNALRKLQQATDETTTLADLLQDQMQEIREHAPRSVGVRRKQTRPGLALCLPRPLPFGLKLAMSRQSMTLRYCTTASCRGLYAPQMGALTHGPGWPR